MSLYLRTHSLGESLWMDEGLSIGIASQPFFDIPGILRQDGSPPLYYMLLSVWMDVFGDGPAETQGLSVAISLLAVPGRAVGGLEPVRPARRLICAALCAVNPFLTVYAQETRMYSLMLRALAARHGGVPARVRLPPPRATCRSFVGAARGSCSTRTTGGSSWPPGSLVRAGAVLVRVRGPPELLRRTR